MGLAGVISIAFLLVTIQLFFAKPTSMKILIPFVLVTILAFIFLLAIDFYIEYHLLHMTPKDSYTRHEKEDGKKSEKKKGKGFKLAFLVIYIHMCVVTWFIYLAFKDLEEEIENQEFEDEPPMEITISHIT
jgi:p-aminobenzoyl-glutamate transporter AbgT